MKPKARIGKIAVALMIYGIVTIGFAALTSSLPLANATPLGTEQLTGISLDTPVIVGSMTIDNLGYDPANGVLSFGGGFGDQLDFDSAAIGFNFTDLSNYFIDGRASDNGPVPAEIAFNNGQLFNPGPLYYVSNVINFPWNAWFQVNPVLMAEFEQQLGFNGTLNLEIIRMPGFDNAYVGLEYTSQTSGTAPVPEPATILLLGTGLVGLAGLARKRIPTF